MGLTMGQGPTLDQSPETQVLVAACSDLLCALGLGLPTYNGGPPCYKSYKVGFLPPHCLKVDSPVWSHESGLGTQADVSSNSASALH